MTVTPYRLIFNGEVPRKLTHRNVVGRNRDIDDQTPSGYYYIGGDEDVWAGGGSYTGWLTAAASVEAISSSTNDNVAGTGARTLTVTGLDANWAIQSETVNLNGVNAVALANTYIRVLEAKVATVGGRGITDGNITVRVASGGATLAYIVAGENNSLQAVYSVPADYEGSVVNFHARLLHATDVKANVILYERPYGAAKLVKHVLALESGGERAAEQTFGVPISVAAKTDLWVSAEVAGDNADIEAGFDLLMYPLT